jgi:predicted permease
MHLADNLLQDVHFGLRLIKRSPLLSCAIVSILALGIGLDTAVFTAINGMLFRARVEKDPESFIQLVPEYSGKFARQGDAWSTSVEDFRAYQNHASSVSNLAAWGMAHATLEDDPNSEVNLLVTCNFFSLYGLEHAKLGRLFLADECSSPGSAPVVVISEEIWRRRFASDPQLVGKSITVNRRLFTVVGVTPARFPGLLKSGLWIPWTMEPLVYGQDFFRDSSTPWLMVEGRLNPGFSKSSAQAELSLIATQQDRVHPGRTTTLHLTNGSFAQHPAERSNAFWIVLLWMGTVTLVLLMVCTNVTTLLLSRASARRQEIAIRLSLGAGRTRLVRMLLTESLILAAMAGVISAYLASRVPGIFATLMPDAPYYPIEPDLTVFAYLAGVTVLAACFAGMAPASESWKLDLSSSLKGHETLLGLGAGKWRMRDLLVVAQVALSVVLLVVTGLVVRVQYSMSSVEPGFETRQVLLVPLNVSVPPYTADSAWFFYRTLEQRVRELPGVQCVSYSDRAPFWGDDEGRDSREEVRLPGQVRGSRRKAAVNVVSTDYFDTLRIPIMRGRAFQSTDITPQKAAPVTIVSQAFARTLWPHDDPLGKIVEWGQSNRLEVVGVAHDTRSESYGAAADGPVFYRLQNPHSFGGPLLVRFRGDPGAVQRALASAIRDIDRDAIGVPRTLRSMVDQMVSRFWILSELVLILGILAVLLAVIGIYGVVAFAVSRRSRELGIRAALGATRSDIIRSVLVSGMRPVFAGLLAGLVLALAGSLVLARVLFGVHPWDPMAYGAISVLLVTSALAATWGPALRAARTNPAAALRHE